MFASARSWNIYSTPGKLQLYVMDADGQHQTQLTMNQVNDFAPDWSPDGSQIVFLSDRDGAPEVYAMNSDGTQQTDVTGTLPKGQRERGNPHWLPGSVRIAFDADTSSERQYHIFTIALDGRDLQQVTHTSVDVFFPTYSKDGRSMAYGQLFDDNWEIIVARADGSGAVRVTNSPGFDFWPAWSPDGQKIAFASKRTGEFDIYVMNRDGSGLHQLTQAADVPNATSSLPTLDGLKCVLAQLRLCHFKH